MHIPHDGFPMEMARVDVPVVVVKRYTYQCWAPSNNPWGPSKATVNVKQKKQKQRQKMVIICNYMLNVEYDILQ